MDLKFTPAEEAFRDEVRAFLAAKLPATLAAKVASGRHLSRADMVQWHAILNERGWLANHWPREYGGTGWSVIEKFIFEHECCLANAPRASGAPSGAKLTTLSPSLASPDCRTRISSLGKLGSASAQVCVALRTASNAAGPSQATMAC